MLIGHKNPHNNVKLMEKYKNEMNQLINQLNTEKAMRIKAELKNKEEKGGDKSSSYQLRTLCSRIRSMAENLSKDNIIGDMKQKGEEEILKEFQSIIKMLSRRNMEKDNKLNYIEN